MTLEVIVWETIVYVAGFLISAKMIIRAERNNNYFKFIARNSFGFRIFCRIIGETI